MYGSFTTGSSLGTGCNIFKLWKLLMLYAKVFCLMIYYRTSSPFYGSRVHSHFPIHSLYIVKISYSNAWQTHMSSTRRLTTPSAYSIRCDFWMWHIKMHKMRFSGCCYCHYVHPGCMCAVPNACKSPMQQQQHHLFPFHWWNNLKCKFWANFIYWYKYILVYEMNCMPWHVDAFGYNVFGLIADRGYKMINELEREKRMRKHWNWDI